MRRRTRTQRDARPDFSKLAWMARRRGPDGRAALQVLQDAILTWYPKELEDSIWRAERMKEKYRAPGGFEDDNYYITFSSHSRRLARRNPFQILWGIHGEDNRYTPRLKAIVIWDSKNHFNVRRVKRVRRRETHRTKVTTTWRPMIT